MVHLSNGTSFSLQTEGGSHTRCDVREPRGLFASYSKTDTVIPLTELPQVIRFMETGKWWLPGAESLLGGHRVSVWQVEKSWRWTVVTILQPCACTSYCGTVRLELVATVLLTGSPLDAEVPATSLSQRNCVWRWGFKEGITVK